MSIVHPDITVGRSVATAAVIKMNNRSGKVAHILRGLEHNKSISEIDTVDADTYNDDPIDATKGYKYKVQYEEIELSVSIDEDNTDQTPPYYVATPQTGVTFTDSTEQFSFPWGNVTVDTIIVDPLRLGPASVTKFTKAP